MFALSRAREPVPGPKTPRGADQLYRNGRHLSSSSSGTAIPCRGTRSARATSSSLRSVYRLKWIEFIEGVVLARTPTVARSGDVGARISSGEKGSPESLPPERLTRKLVENPGPNAPKPVQPCGSGLCEALQHSPLHPRDRTCQRGDAMLPDARTGNGRQPPGCQPARDRALQLGQRQKPRPTAHPWRPKAPPRRHGQRRPRRYQTIQTS